MCTLFIPDRDKVISVASEHLEPVCPEKGDRVSCSLTFRFSLTVALIVDFDWRVLVSKQLTSCGCGCSVDVTCGAAGESDHCRVGVGAVWVWCVVPQVKVITGEDREFTGHLLSIDGLEGVVKLDRGNLNMFQMSCLCRVPKDWLTADHTRRTTRVDGRCSCSVEILYSTAETVLDSLLLICVCSDGTSVSRLGLGR